MRSCILITLISLIFAWPLAADNKPSLDRKLDALEDQLPNFQNQTNLGRDLAMHISALTGVAVSPLFGMSAISAYVYFKTPSDKRSTLPWYNTPYVWGTGSRCFFYLYLTRNWALSFHC